MKGQSPSRGRNTPIGVGVVLAQESEGKNGVQGKRSWQQIGDIRERDQKSKCYQY